TNSPELVGKTTAFLGHKEPIVFSNHFLRLRTNGRRLDPQYLARWLTKQWQLRVFEKYCTQWVNQATVRKEDLLSLEIPLPPLDEQRRIAAILSRADRLRRLRRTALELSDGYLQSVFLEMFGDPVSNPMGWKRTRVAKLVKVQTGNTPSRAESENYGNFIEWIKSDNINTPSHFLTQATEFLSEKGKSVGRTAPMGSTLITCIAGSFDCIGNAAYADREVAFNQQINALTAKSGVNSWFLYALVIFSKKHIQSASTNSMKGMVSKGKMEGIQFISPPEKIQLEFEKVFSRYREGRDKQDTSMSMLNDGFSSISQRAFSVGL
ncbi:MAG: restriction endonuclease subunit S, partial [Nitrospira sp.]|nr:restriction endonuclease subunit S [Nitrospira sp.]